MSTHNVCFGEKIRKKVYPCKPQHCYVKVGLKGVYISRTCFHDEASKIFIRLYRHYIPLRGLLHWDVYPSVIKRKAIFL